jgi:ankyrin repeat protein
MDKIMEIIHKNFEEYCTNENFEKIREYLQKYEWLANYNDGEYFETIADKGNLDLIKLFIENGVNINTNNDYALYTCSYHKYDKCIEYLLNHGANIENVNGSCGHSYLNEFVKTNKLLIS